MLEKLDLTKTLSKSEYKEKMLELEPRLGKLQRECKEMGIPVMIAFEGYDAAGKGLQIGEMIQALDPRGFEVHAVKKETKEERMHPFLWRFWTKMPAKGRIAVYDSSWYRKVLIDRFDRKIRKKEVENAYRSILSFEEQLTADGMVIVKIFLAIDQQEQKKRFDKLLESKETAWRVGKGDLKRNKEFKKYEAMNEEMLSRTDTEYAPWHIVEAVDRRFATVKIYTIVDRILSEKIAEVKEQKARSESGMTDTAETGKSLDEELTIQIGGENMAAKDKKLHETILSKADLSLSYSKEEYKERLDKLQRKIEKLHGELYRR